MSTDTTIDTEALGDSVQTSLNTLFHSGGSLPFGPFSLPSCCWCSAWW